MSSEQAFSIEAVRSRFPALGRVDDGLQVAYLDGPGGTQAPQEVIDAFTKTLGQGVSNLGGEFGASMDADQIVEEARSAMSDFFNCSPSEVAFGQNMTSLTFALSRAIAAQWAPGDTIVLTSLDHDANYTPWVRAAKERGVEVRVAEFDVESGALDPEAVGALLDETVRLVAVCAAANSIGTVVDIGAIVRLAHAVGAVVCVDAVHLGPHRSIDVQALDCDFLLVSSYKFFGPHSGVVYGKLDRLAEIDAYRIRPAPPDPPGKWETGTQSFESLAGVAAAVNYLAGLGGESGSRRERLVQAYEWIDVYEQSLIDRFLAGVAAVKGVRVYGSTTAATDRVATFALGSDRESVGELASRMIAAGLYVWSGDYYAVNVMDRFGLADSGGLVRVGFMHYNTAAEVDRVLEVLAT